MSERGEVRVGATLIQYTVARSRRRRKTVAISLDGDAVVKVAVPMGLSVARVEEILAQRAAWILQRMATLAPQPRRRFVSGECVPYVGRNVSLLIGSEDVKRVGLRATSGGA